ncbi:MAG: XdhC family protein [Pyrobaculum sp.]
MCEVFKALTSIERAVVVKLYDRSGKVLVDVYTDGKFLFGAIGGEEALRLAETVYKTGGVREAEIGGLRAVAEFIEVGPLITVVGSGAVAKALVELGSAAGYRMAVVSPEGEEFPKAVLTSRDLKDLEKLVGEGSVVVVATGGKPYEADVLYLALTRGAKYVGLLASQRRAAAMVAELVRRGLGLRYVLQKLRSPVGLDIGAKTAGEIAISILAEVTMALRSGTGKPLREVKSPELYLEKEVSLSSCS